MNSKILGQTKLGRIATYGEWICAAGIALVGGYYCYLAFNPAEAVAVLQRGIPGQINLPSDSIMILAGLVALLPILLFLFALWQVRKMFGLIGSGFFLSEGCQKLMVQLGRIAIVSAILGIVARTVIVLLMTSANPLGQKILLVEIGSGEISSIMFSILFFTFALLVKESATLAEENRSFI